VCKNSGHDVKHSGNTDYLPVDSFPPKEWLKSARRFDGKPVNLQAQHSGPGKMPGRP